MLSLVPHSPSGYLTLQFLAWLAERPRSYGEAMEEWRTSCPRLSIWEDALGDGLIALGDGLIALGEGHWRARRVTLTPHGRAVLDATTPQRLAAE